MAVTVTVTVYGHVSNQKGLEWRWKLTEEMICTNWMSTAVR